MEAFCDRCARDAAYRSGDGDSCPIAAATMAFDAEDPNYPSEWQYGPDGQPRCTAFTLETPPDHYRCEKTPDLFGTSAERTA
jgi:hypothetical protein